MGAEPESPQHDILRCRARCGCLCNQHRSRKQNPCM